MLDAIRSLDRRIGLLLEYLDALSRGEVIHPRDALKVAADQLAAIQHVLGQQGRHRERQRHSRAVAYWILLRSAVQRRNKTGHRRKILVTRPMLHRAGGIQAQRRHAGPGQFIKDFPGIIWSEPAGQPPWHIRCELLQH